MATNGAAHDGHAHDGAAHDGAAHDGAAHDGAAHDGAAHDVESSKLALRGARRGLALAGGGLLVLRGITRPSLLGLMYASAGVSLLSRAITGSWFPRRAFGLAGRARPAPREPAANDAPRDVVDEASWQSFPASDPPSYSPR